MPLSQRLKKFSPPFLFRNRHVQTVFHTFARRYPFLPPHDLWSIPVDGEVSLRGKYWSSDQRKDLVLIYHGLGGSSESGYVIGAALSLQSAGFHVVRMELRGAEREPPFTPTMYHSGLVEDFTRAVEEAQRRGFERIFLLGFSLSSNMILRWLGLQKRPVAGAFVVSPPVRLSVCANLIDSRRNKIYQLYFLQKLR